MAVPEIPEAVEPLRLSCGHELSEVVTSGEGTAFCGACARADSIEAEAVEEVEEEREDEQSQEAEQRDDERFGVEEGTITVDAVEVEPGGPQDGSARVAAHEEQRQDEADSTPPQPAYGTRGTEPGPRGCWAVKQDGTACASFKRRDGDFCTAHAGLGIGTDPSHYSPIAHEARRRQLETRARLRMVMGDRGRLGPRAVLREHVHREAERLARRALNGALNPEVDDAKAANLAIRLIAEADPAQTASVEISGALSSEQIERMSLSEAIAYAEQLGIEVPTSPEALPAGLPRAATEA